MLNFIRQDAINTQMKAVAKAWKDEYLGDYDQIFIDSIQEMNKLRTPSTRFANYMSIIQSSGTGKSRLVDQVACSLFCIPFNLRHWQEAARSYPPSDDQIRQVLLTRHISDAAYTQSACVEFLYDHFFALVFDKVTEALDTNLSNNHQFQSSKELASWWRNFLAQGKNRSELYNNIAVMTKKALYTKLCIHNSYEEPSRVPNDDNLPNEFISQRAITRLLLKLKSLLPPGTINDGPVGRPKGIANSPLNEEVRIIMYFDEAHDLDTPSSYHDRNSVSMHHLFVKTLNNLNSFPIFTVFISTDPNMLISSPCQNAPYTELPFDCSKHIAGMFTENKLYISEVNSADWMSKFGRPLFWSLRVDRDVWDFTLPLAHTKLSCGDDRSKSFHLAALTTRLNLQLDISRREGRLEAANLVAFHMRIIFSAPQHRQYFESGAPSEPLLAEAAVKCMAEIRSYTDSIALLLLGFMEKGIADKGERGELVARHLVTEAFDHAAKVEKVDYATERRPWKGTGAVTVEQFFVSLLGMTNANNVLNMRADNMGVNNGRKLWEVFSRSVIRFTHFVRAGDDFANTSDAAFAALGRGFAVICRPGTDGMDFYISVVIDEEQPLSEANTTAILIKVKDGIQNADSVDTAVTTVEELRFFPEESEPRPYIVIVMELVPPPKWKESIPIQRPEEQTAQTKGKHPRYSIIVTGCSPVTYGVIEDKSVYAKLLRPDCILDELSRQEPEYISALKRLKPTWTLGSDCWDWVQSDFLCTGQEISEELREEYVQCGSEYFDHLDD